MKEVSTTKYYQGEETKTLGQKMRNELYLYYITTFNKKQMKHNLIRCWVTLGFDDCIPYAWH